MNNISKLIAILILLMSSLAVSAQTNVDTLLIGVLVPDSELHSSNASDVRQAVQLAIDEINDAGGINNTNDSETYRLQVVYKDVANAEDVSLAIADLTAEGVVAILGPDSNALLPDLSNLTVPLLFTSSGLDGAYHETSEYVYQLRANDDSLARTAMTFVTEELESDELAIVSAEATYGNIASEAILEAVADTDDMDVLINRTLANGETDTSSIVDDIVNENPDTILVADRLEVLANLLDNLSNSDWSGDVVYLFGNSELHNISVSDDIDLYSLNIWSPMAEDQTSEDFVDLYSETYAQSPSLASVLYYDGINFVSAGLEVVGGDSQELENWFATTAEYSGVQGDYNAANDVGELIRNVFIFQIESGEMNEETRYVSALDG